MPEEMSYYLHAHGQAKCEVNMLAGFFLIVGVIVSLTESVGVMTIAGSSGATAVSFAGPALLFTGVGLRAIAVWRERQAPIR